MTYRKKLIEVALPLKAINAAAAREKSIRHGHPSTLHLWWARRPLAAARAVLFAQLVDDPASRPDKFPTPQEQEAERKRLFDIIEELVKWENSANEEVLERARAAIRESCGEPPPPVYDPFSGGCSIPLEAQRLGLPAYGSDLNPVAVMIGKAMIEIPPRFKGCAPAHPGGRERTHYRNAEGLAEDVKHYGEWMRERAFERIGRLYPQADLPAEHGGGKATVIAWIWARTVPSPDPAFAGAPVPIASSFLLSAKSGREAWIEPLVDKQAKTIRYRIRKGGTRAEIAKAKKGTKAGRGANFRCLLSDTAITPDYVKSSGASGKMGQKLIAIVAEGKNGRVYVEPFAEHEQAALTTKPAWKPETPLPGNILACWTPPYGLRTVGDLFTDRQLIALTAFSELVHETRAEIEHDGIKAGFTDDPTPLRDGGNGAKAYAEAVSVYLAFIVDKCSDYWSSICSWHSSRQLVRNTFGRQVIPMVWDFAEANPFSTSAGNWMSMCDWAWKAAANFDPKNSGRQRQHDAQTISYPGTAVISTDPPYYNNIGYADLSDFFFCWMKPALQQVYPDLFGVLATPKAEELIASPYRHGGKGAAEDFFLDGMRKAVANMARRSSSAYPATIYYAFKQSEIERDGVASTGWATFLQAVLDAGYAVAATWPMRTELANRMVAQGTNALANSIVMVCRKRESGAETIYRSEFVRALKRELPPALAELQKASIAPADMPQSAIGPGIAVFSRCKEVLESDDSRMSVKTALQLINRELDAYLGGLQGEFDDETRLAAAWFAQNAMETGDYGDANSIATARGITVESVQQAGILDATAGRVRILRRDELPKGWDPAADRSLTAWECCQHLIRVLEDDGERAAAALLKRMGGDHGEAAKDLAYCLYDICDKRRDAGEAAAYNGLIAAWPELTRLADEASAAPAEQQTALEL